jgi:Tol biopolymer transport system component
LISDSEGNVVAEIAVGTGWRISWSPDSTRVAVWVNFRESIGVFGVDGARQALLTMPPGYEMQGDFDPMWMPDGESLRVHDVVLPIDGSTPHSIDPRAPYTLGAVTSPDGSRVAHIIRNSLVVAEADGSNPQMVFRGDRSESLAVIDFSPEGDRILFSRTTDSESSLWSVKADGSDLRHLVAGTASGDWLSPRPTR